MVIYRYLEGVTNVVIGNQEAEQHEQSANN